MRAKKVKMRIVLKHPGAMTARAKRNGVTVKEEAKKDLHSANPRVRKQAVFAINAAKWSRGRRKGGRK